MLQFGDISSVYCMLNKKHGNSCAKWKETGSQRDWSCGDRFKPGINLVRKQPNSGISPVLERIRSLSPNIIIFTIYVWHYYPKYDYPSFSVAWFVRGVECRCLLRLTQQNVKAIVAYETAGVRVMGVPLTNPVFEYWNGSIMLKLSKFA